MVAFSVDTSVTVFPVESARLVESVLKTVLQGDVSADNFAGVLMKVFLMKECDAPISAITTYITPA